MRQNKGYDLTIEGDKLKARYKPESKRYMVYFVKSKKFLWFSHYWNRQEIPDDKGKIQATPAFQQVEYKMGWSFDTIKDARTMIRLLRESRLPFAKDEVAIVRPQSSIETYLVEEVSKLPVKKGSKK